MKNKVVSPAPVPNGYRRKRDKTKIVRLVAELDVDIVKRIDDWGISSQMPTRTATVRHLIDAGLNAEKASGNAGKLTPDASDSE